LSGHFPDDTAKKGRQRSEFVAGSSGKDVLRLHVEWSEKTTVLCFVTGFDSILPLSVCPLMSEGSSLALLDERERERERGRERQRDRETEGKREELPHTIRLQPPPMLLTRRHTYTLPDIQYVAI
jgi:hypothetical protein